MKKATILSDLRVVHFVCAVPLSVSGNRNKFLAKAGEQQQQQQGIAKRNNYNSNSHNNNNKRTRAQQSTLLVLLISCLVRCSPPCRIVIHPLIGPLNPQLRHCH